MAVEAPDAILGPAHGPSLNRTPIDVAAIAPGSFIPGGSNPMVDQRRIENVEKMERIYGQARQHLAALSMTLNQSIEEVAGDKGLKDAMPPTADLGVFTQHHVTTLEERKASIRGALVELLRRLDEDLIIGPAPAP